MTSVLLDTHTFAWSLNDDPKITETARDAITGAESVFVSAVSFFEIAQKVRIGKWPDMEPRVSNLEAELVRTGSAAIALTPEIAIIAGRLDWPHRDPFDRMIAATVIAAGLVLVSADPVFDRLPLRRVW
jgi:PIN domain nuclease of toxin-antitoxin system